MDNSDSNIARDAYSASDAYSSRDAHSKRDAYANKNPYENKGRTEEEKERSIYGWGKYCDHFFELENLFRTKFTDDTQIHDEKREYVGSGDLAAVIPKMSKITGSSFILVVLIFTISALLLFFSHNKYILPASMATITIFFLWRFACPSYLVYKSEEYVIGDEYKKLYKNFVFFINFIEIVNFLLASFLLFYSTRQQESIRYLMQQTAEYLSQHSPVLQDHFMELSHEQIQFAGIEYLAALYMFLVVAYHLYFTYFRRVVVAKKLIENLRDIKLKRLANQYQRKSFILNGENL